MEHQSKILHAISTKELRDTFRKYDRKRNVQNRVALTQKIHESRMEDLSAMASYIDRFDDHTLRIEGVGDMMDVRLNAIYQLLVTIPVKLNWINTDGHEGKVVGGTRLDPATRDFEGCI